MFNNKRKKITKEMKKIFTSMANLYADDFYTSEQITNLFEYNNRKILEVANHMSIQLLWVDDDIAEKIYRRALYSSINKDATENNYIKSFEIRENNKIELKRIAFEIEKIKKQINFHKSFLNSPNSSKESISAKIIELNDKIKDLKKNIA